MEIKEYGADDSVKAILSELSNAAQLDDFKEAIDLKGEDIDLNSEELEEFILKNGAKTVSTTQNIISLLLAQIQVTPDAELITSVAEMIGSNNKALETLTKIHLNNEKLKQAKELEQFKQATKLQIADKVQNRPQLSREEIMKLFYEEDKSVRIVSKTPSKKIEAPE